MEEITFCTRCCLDEEGHMHRFRYSLLISTIPAGQFQFEDYGVKVEEAGADTVSLPSLTHNRTRIEALLSLLVQHAVTPINLPEIAEDWAKENHLPQPKLQQVADAQ